MAVGAYGRDCSHHGRQEVGKRDRKWSGVKRYPSKSSTSFPEALPSKTLSPPNMDINIDLIHGLINLS